MSAFTVGLPKSPALVVEGGSVSREQAARILIQTQTHFGCNVHDHCARVFEVLGYPQDPYHTGEFQTPGFNWSEHFAKEEAAAAKLGRLDLTYLDNSRIVSAWVGGTKGWCAWDGTIGCRTFNIGKWPAVEEVTAEWTTIAQAYPFLTLTAQLFDRETCEDDPIPLVEFRVTNGTVEVGPPVADLGKPQDRAIRDFTATGLEREIGCTIEYLHWARAQC